MKFSIEIYFINDKVHNFLYECDSIEEIDDLLNSYAEQNKTLIDAQDLKNPCLFNPASVAYILATECEGSNNPNHFNEDFICR